MTTTSWKAGPTLFAPSDLDGAYRGRGYAMPLDDLWNGRITPSRDLDALRPAGTATVVTGGAGFLGARLVAQLLDDPSRGMVVVASRRPRAVIERWRALFGLDHAARYAFDERLRLLPVDFAAPSAVRHVEHVLDGTRLGTIHHLAAAVDAFASRERLASANETATANVCRIAARTGARLVHASTLSVFVSSNGGDEKAEDWLPDDAGTLLFGGYAQTKAKAEVTIAGAMIERGIDATIARLGLLVPAPGDPAEPSFLHSFIQALARIGAVPETAEEALVDMTPVDQAAAALIALADSPRSGIRHYANPIPMTLTETVSLIAARAPLTVVDDAEWRRRVATEDSIPGALLEAAFRKTRFVRERCATRPLVNADLFQTTARGFSIDAAAAQGAPLPRAPSESMEAAVRRALGTERHDGS